ncbi:MAG: hypothetical protein FWC29_06145 [Methanomassiliicoccaceae archaeon]|nr:hypothetical protein [Methanomassiliicoccaceae archaeon]
MSTIKIMDTCTLINVFDMIDLDLSSCLQGYQIVVTDHVVSEYTRKIPRSIPKCLSVVGMNATDLLLMNEMEFMFPQLGIGERSVFVFALGVALRGHKVVVLSDDKSAVKKFSNTAKEKAMSERFPGSENIVWGDTLSLLDKFVEKGKITRTQSNQAYKIIKN